MVLSSAVICYNLMIISSGKEFVNFVDPLWVTVSGEDISASQDA